VLYGGYMVVLLWVLSSTFCGGKQFGTNYMLHTIKIQIKMK